MQNLPQVNTNIGLKNGYGLLKVAFNDLRPKSLQNISLYIVRDVNIEITSKVFEVHHFLALHFSNSPSFPLIL